MWTIENVISKKDDLVGVYDKLINDPSWYLSHGSNQGTGPRHPSEGAEVVLPTTGAGGYFPALSVYNTLPTGTIIRNEYWFSYFDSLLPVMTKKLKEQHGIILPEKLFRIHVVAKQAGSFEVGEPHADMAGSDSAISLIGLLTPEWKESWGGEFTCEGEDPVFHVPGNFIAIKSARIHNGSGPKIEIPYWRVVVNYLLVSQEDFLDRHRKQT